MLTYRHAAATAYLDAAKGHEQNYDGILLCDLHAQRFSAPVGWTTIDRTRSDATSGYDGGAGPYGTFDASEAVQDAD